MCRSIKTLRVPAAPVADDDIAAAARQFVRKISGFNRPSKLNEEVFEQAIVEIASASRRLLDSLVVRPPSARPSPPAAEP